MTGAALQIILGGFIGFAIGWFIIAPAFEAWMRQRAHRKRRWWE